MLFLTTEPHKQFSNTTGQRTGNNKDIKDMDMDIGTKKYNKLYAIQLYKRCSNFRTRSKIREETSTNQRTFNRMK